MDYMLKQLDPLKINIIEMPNIDMETMKHIMFKIAQIEPDAAKNTILLSGVLNIKEFTREELIKLKDEINNILEMKDKNNNKEIERR